MTSLRELLIAVNYDQDEKKTEIVSEIRKLIDQADYSLAELNSEKPWGAYFRIESAQADKFVADFFPDLTPERARLGIENAELSPKILLVSPAQRLSWQYHNRRAERWAFLTTGLFYRSVTDDQDVEESATPGTVVQFAQGERHRLVGATESYTVVAEIWQHTDPEQPSNEEDIVRLADDYSR